MDRTHARDRAPKSLVVVGAGGNIGSHLVSHLARIPEVSRLVLIDKDVFEETNLRSQDIGPADIARPKVEVLRRRLGRIRPELRVEALHADVRDVPLGRLRCDLILACVDTRIARQHVNQAAWRLGIPWVDAGVDAAGLLARTNIYVPGRDAPCLECDWYEGDYEAIEQSYPCRPDGAIESPTNAPSSLGALAASLQAIECQKLLAGKREPAAMCRQVLWDARCHTLHITDSQRNPRCRFDHQVWRIRKSAAPLSALTIGGALARGRGARGPLALQVEGKPFVRGLTCPACGYERRLLRLVGRLRGSQRRCRCGREMIAAGLDFVERLDDDVLTERLRKLPLSRLGFLPGDVFTITGRSTESHWEIQAG